MTHNNDPADLTGGELSERYTIGELSPVEAARACLDRIDAHDGTLNAYCLTDEPVTLAAARRAEERYRRGMPLGPLDGVPVAIKDVFLTRGWPTLKGSRTVDPNQDWQADAPSVAALKRHGAVPLGKTTTPELGWKGVTDCPLTGVTVNPWNPALTAGGSSGGSAAAVAAGMGPLALGTDAGGSVRIPAAFCGIVGHKPTQARVPMWPASPFAPLAHIGPMTWTVADTAALMNVLCEPDPRDAILPPNGEDFLADLDKGVRGWRIAYSPTLGYADVDPEIAAAVEEAVRVFETLGAVVERVDPGFADPREPFERLFYGGTSQALAAMTDAQRAVMDPELVAVADELAGLSMLEHQAAAAARTALIEHTERFHRRYDLLLTPTVPIPAFAAGREVSEDWPAKRWHTWSPFTYPFNLTGQPALSVPCGFTEAGLPIGLQLVGARHADAAVLRAGHAYQCMAPLTDRRPAPPA